MSIFCFNLGPSVYKLQSYSNFCNAVSICNQEGIIRSPINQVLDELWDASDAVADVMRSIRLLQQ